MSKFLSRAVLAAGLLAGSTGGALAHGAGPAHDSLTGVGHGLLHSGQSSWLILGLAVAVHLTLAVIGPKQIDALARTIGLPRR